MRMFISLVILLHALSFADCQLTGDEEVTCLRISNELRQLHKETDPLVWNSKLAEDAQNWAEYLVSSGRFEHADDRGGAGENLFSMTGGRVGKCADAEAAWYSEIKDFNFQAASSSNGNVVGHFTQEVWKGTKEIGVGLAKDTSNPKAIKTIIVARYSPAGNSYFIGEKYQAFSENVKETKTGEAVTPSIFELDGSLCANYLTNCDLYQRFRYCESHPSFTKSYCPKECKFC